LITEQCEGGEYFSVTCSELKDTTMSKGDRRRGNKEIKKPKQEKPKAPAPTTATSGRTPIVVAGKKLK
jgi:hypothetical protein